MSKDVTEIPVLDPLVKAGVLDVPTGADDLGLTKPLASTLAVNHGFALTHTLRSAKLPHCRAKRRCLGAIVQPEFQRFIMPLFGDYERRTPNLRLTAMGLTSSELAGVGTNRRKSAICD